ncbi:dihydrodipicolinate reductase, partial [bacterium]
MTRLALVGYGKMGRLVEQLAPEHGFEVALRLDGSSNAGGAGLTAGSVQGVEVAVD